ncbi:hypothetical protein O3P69_004288 [Scylla paramamosain]|uniref:Uncharacterized protein n=1 Tax=Scylla paramamosain TaxID=85552 RepID=A0AAW0UJW6_SCYPA
MNNPAPFVNRGRRAQPAKIVRRARVGWGGGTREGNGNTTPASTHSRTIVVNSTLSLLSTPRRPSLRHHLTAVPPTPCPVPFQIRRAKGIQPASFFVVYGNRDLPPPIACLA